MMPHDRISAITLCVSDATQNNRLTRGREKARLVTVPAKICGAPAINRVKIGLTWIKYPGLWLGQHWRGNTATERRRAN